MGHLIEGLSQIKKDSTNVGGSVEVRLDNVIKKKQSISSGTTRAKTKLTIGQVGFNNGQKNGFEMFFEKFSTTESNEIGR